MYGWVNISGGRQHRCQCPPRPWEQGSARLAKLPAKTLSLHFTCQFFKFHHVRKQPSGWYARQTKGFAFRVTILCNSILCCKLRDLDWLFGLHIIELDQRSYQGRSPGQRRIWTLKLCLTLRLTLRAQSRSSLVPFCASVQALLRKKYISLIPLNVIQSRVAFSVSVWLCSTVAL